MSARKPMLPNVWDVLHGYAPDGEAAPRIVRAREQARAAEAVIRAADRLDRAARGLSGAKWAVVTAQHRRAVDRWRRVTRRTP